ASFAAENVRAANDLVDYQTATDGTLTKPVNESSNTTSAFMANISTIFNYTSGILTSIGDKNGGFYIYSNGRQFATLGKNSDGSFTITSINLDNIDQAKIDEMPGNTDEEKLVNYLLSIGLDKSQLMTQKDYYTTDENGNKIPVSITKDMTDAEVNSLTGGDYATAEAYLNREKTEYVAWLTIASDDLKKGVNHSLQIGLTGGGAASLTTIENGQAIASYNGKKDADGSAFKSADFIYKNGFPTMVKQYGWEVTYLNGNTDLQGDIDTYEQALEAYIAGDPINRSEKTFLEIDENNDGTPDNKELKDKYDTAISDSNTIFKYEKSTTIVHYNAAGQQSYITDNAGDVIMKYNYSVNGSMTSTFDEKSKIRTNYVNGSPSEIINSAGYVSAKYNYFPDGGLSDVTSYNNGMAVGYTFYFNGKALGTVDLTEEVITPDQARVAYREATTPGKTTDEIYAIFAQYHIKSLEIYKENLDNTNLMKVLLHGLNDDVFNQHMNFMRNNSDGYSSVGSAQIVWGEQVGSTIDEFTFDGKKYKSEEEVNEAIVDSIRSTSKDYGQIKDKDGNQLLNSDGTWKEGKSAKDMDLDVSTSKAQSSHGVTKTTYTTYVKNVTVNLTLNAHGAPSHSINGIAKPTEEATGRVETSTTELGGFYDPAVIGVIDSFVDADGNVIEDVDQYFADNPGAKAYAKLNASGINMMDGSGFQPADGEEIYVEITEDMAKELSVGKEAMFMGDVAKSGVGEYVMRTNDNYNVTVNGNEYKGFVTGADLEAAKAEVQKESIKAQNGESKYNWMNVNTKANREIFGLGTGYLDSWVTGWTLLANLNS
ncbi:MAG: hypothetical protein LBL00_02685, partial [Endomicrobium sp.]|nr:hypothetical protein [Endomicrobium sp.]